MRAGHRQCSGCYTSKEKKTAAITEGLKLPEAGEVMNDPAAAQSKFEFPAACACGGLLARAPNPPPPPIGDTGDSLELEDFIIAFIGTPAFFSGRADRLRLSRSMF